MIKNKSKKSYIRKSVVLLTHVNGTKNPMLKMFVDVLLEKNDCKIIVISKDGMDDINTLGIRVISLSNKSFSFLVRFISSVISKFCSLIALLINKKNFDRNKPYAFCDFLLVHIFFTIKSCYYILINKPVINVCIDAGALNTARIIKSIIGTPYIYSIYEVYPDQIRKDVNPKLRKLYMYVEKWGMERADVLLSPLTEKFGNFLNRRYHLQKRVRALSVCPDKLINRSSIIIKKPLKFYS